VSRVSCTRLCTIRTQAARAASGGGGGGDEKPPTPDGGSGGGGGGGGGGGKDGEGIEDIPKLTTFVAAMESCKMLELFMESGDSRLPSCAPQLTA
jgi:hypothetical protein